MLRALAPCLCHDAQPYSRVASSAWRWQVEEPLWGSLCTPSTTETEGQQSPRKTLGESPSPFRSATRTLITARVDKTTPTATPAKINDAHCDRSPTVPYQPYDATTDADIDEFTCFNQDDDAVYVAPDGATFLSLGAAHLYAGEESPLSGSMQSASLVPKIVEESKGTDISELDSSFLQPPGSNAIQSDDTVEAMLMQRYESIEYVQKPQIKKALEEKLQAKLDVIIEQASTAFFETSTVKVLEIADDDWLKPAGPKLKGSSRDDATRLSQELSVATKLKSLKSKSKSKSKTCDSNSKHILPKMNPQSESSEISNSKSEPQQLDKIKQRKRKAPSLYGNLLSTEYLAKSWKSSRSSGVCSCIFTGLWLALYILHAIMFWIIFLKHTRMLHGYMTCLDLCRKLDCQPAQAIDYGYGTGGKRRPIKRSLLLTLAHSHLHTVQASELLVPPRFLVFCPCSKVYQGVLVCVLVSVCTFAIHELVCIHMYP